MWDRLKSWLCGRRSTSDVPPKETSLGPPSGSAAGAAETSPAGTSAAALQGEVPLSGDRLRACYRELGAPEGADLNTVRRAWKAELKKVHMDHYADDREVQARARDRTRRLNEAYHVLREKLF